GDSTPIITLAHTFLVGGLRRHDPLHIRASRLSPAGSCVAPPSESHKVRENAARRFRTSGVLAPPNFDGLSAALSAALAQRIKSDRTSMYRGPVLLSHSKI